MAIEDLIDKIFDDNPVEAQKEFESELQQKLSAALDTKKQEMSSSLFGGVKPEETPKEVPELSPEETPPLEAEPEQEVQ
jgi:hypothetical protein